MGNLTDHFSSSGGSNVLEVLSSPCDGRTVTVGSGTYTMQNPTTLNTPATSYANYNGSVIDYLPPSGTTKVIYEFHHQTGFRDTHSIIHFRLYIAGAEVTAARRTSSGYYGPDTTHNFMWTFEIGSTADAANGVITSWDTAKELKWMHRNYSTGNEGYTNGMRYFDGGGSTSFSRPVLKITALS
jgi:hypothetical protein